MKITPGLIEQHIHGAFGIDFMNCSKDDIKECSAMLLKNGVSAFFPTIMTDSLNIIKERIKIIKQAQSEQTKEMAQIAGIHLEGPFINPEKAGIHEKRYIQPLYLNIFNEIYDEIIKIVTLAPETDNKCHFVNYLKEREIKVSAGHSTATDLSMVNQITHLYNAMGAFSHRGDSTVVSALTDNSLYVEIIADSMHVSDNVLKITFKQKPLEKILLISDALPLAHSEKQEQFFAGQKIYNKNGQLVNEFGTFAGSSMLLSDIVKNLVQKNILSFEDCIKCASENQTKYHNIQNTLKVYWNDDYTINKTELK